MSDVVETKETVALDSNGIRLESGDRVHVSLELARPKSFWEETESREFDFGDVDSVNEDGTVTVWWDSAGCSCDSGEGRVEQSSDLTRVDDEMAEHLETVAQLSFAKGYKEGTADLQRELRDLLGIDEDN